MKKAYLIVLLLSNFVFSQDNYNRTWATYFGGSGFDVSDAVTDRFGNLVVSALVSPFNTALSNDVAYYNQFKTATGLSCQAGMDAGNQSFVAKFSPDGTLLFATYLPYGIVEIQQNKQNKWVIRGHTNQTNLGTAGTWLVNPSAVSVNSYSIITQLTEDFTTEWFSYIPNTANTSTVDDFYLDDNHNIYLHTKYSDDSFPNLTTPNTFQPSFILQYDVNNNIIPNGYLCKLNNFGQQQWGTFLGLMSVNDVVITDSNLVITGFREENLPAYDSYYCTETNCDVTATEYVFAKFDPNTGQRIFSKYIPSNIFLGGDTVTDGSNFYVLNLISSNDKMSLNAYQAANGGLGYDLYLAKYNSNFQLQWATYIGGSGFEYPNDYLNWLEYKDGYLYLSAWTDSTNNFIFSPNPYSATKQGNDDDFIMKFSTDGALVWGSYYGGLGHENFNSKIVPTSNEAFYICGRTTSTSAMTTTGCHQSTMNIHPVLNIPFGDKWNCYIAKFSPVVLSSDSFAENTIQIYPNPSNGIVTISGGNLSKEKHQLTIYNELGQQVYNKNMALFNEYTINLSHLSKGVYFITLQSEESNLKQSEKLIIK